MNEAKESETPDDQGSASSHCSTPQEFYIVDIRGQWDGQKYITFWRPNNSNYAWPLSWAGRYTKEQVDAEGHYYCNTNGSRKLLRFPVPCDVVEAMATEQPDWGDIDGNVGPVVRKTKKTERKLRQHAYIPPGAVLTPAGA
jgi:hypothetical protein